MWRIGRSPFSQSAYWRSSWLSSVTRWSNTFPSCIVDRPYLFVFPAIGAIAATVLALSILRHNDHWPFYMVALIFVSAFGTLALSFWPYMIPFVITIDEAASPRSSLVFMFWGCGVIVFPLMLLYTVISYTVFRGKVRAASGYGHH